MQERLIRVKEVSEMTSLSRTTIYNLMREGKFPQQRRLSHKVAVWRKSEVDQWMGGVLDEDLLL